MNCRLPLPALLSHALVAFTIEFDNESERQTVHRTTRHGSTAGSLQAPWLVSLVMWLNCMLFVGGEGVTVRELERLARTKTNLAGMQRWGYFVVETDRSRRKSEGLIRATPAGKKAQEVWRPLVGAIGARWQERFGGDRIAQLRESLLALAAQMDSGLPRLPSNPGVWPIQQGARSQTAFGGGAGTSPRCKPRDAARQGAADLRDRI
jgi:hypothetical protein